MPSQDLLLAAAKAEGLAAEAEKSASERELFAQQVFAEAAELRALANQKRAAANASLAAAGNVPPTRTPSVDDRGVPEERRPSVVKTGVIVAAIVGVILLTLAVWMFNNHRSVSATASNAADVADTAKKQADRAMSTAEGADKKASAANTKSDTALQDSKEAVARAGTCNCDKGQPAQQKSQRRPKSPPVLPPKVVMKFGGCIYTSDGNAILRGTTDRQPKGKELARISNENLQSSAVPAIKSILASHSDAFVTNVGHISMCNAWSDYIAGILQDPKGLRVNNDTHRVPN